VVSITLKAVIVGKDVNYIDRLVNYTLSIVIKLKSKINSKIL
jgi:hypothetical protein